ncbi:MAG: hypothetical protein R6X14_04495 [bacterium]
MKKRAIVWILVGVVAAAAVLFLLLTRQRGFEPDLGGVRQQAVMVEGRLAALEQKLAEARAQLPPGQDPVQFAPVEQLVMDSRNALTGVHELDNLDEAMAKLGQARSSYSSALRQFRKLTRRPRR